MDIDKLTTDELKSTIEKDLKTKALIKKILLTTIIIFLVVTIFFYIVADPMPLSQAVPKIAYLSLYAYGIVLLTLIMTTTIDIIEKGFKSLDWEIIKRVTFFIVIMFVIGVIAYSSFTFMFGKTVGTYIFTGIILAGLINGIHELRK